jgi:Fusaric acid resistance protein family
MQILGPFGPLFAFRIGQPGISVGIREGAITIAIAALMQAAIVPITGKLLDYPGLIMAFLFVVFTALMYLSSNTGLFMLIALTAVGTITTVYTGIFAPGRIGWGSTYTFDGILVATLVLVVVDTLLWPSPPELRLRESIAADLGRTRERFEAVGRRYLDPFDAPLPPPQIASALASNLALLKAVEEQAKSPSEVSALLDSVTNAERVRLEVERLALLAEEPVPDAIRQRHREKIEEALKALDEALAIWIGDILTGGSGMERPESIKAGSETMQPLHALNSQLSPGSDQATELELANLVGFVAGLVAVASMLEPQERTLDSAIASTTEDESEPRPLIDPAAFRFSVKIGAAMTLALLVGLTTQRPDLQTILWSVVVAGLPNTYGGVVRKTILRLAGCIAGGLAALAAMIFVSQNFDSLPPYLVAIFAVTMLSTYVAQSSEWLGYAGIQAGITFLICYVGLAPSSNVYAPLWRLWGIVLGVITTAFVFLSLWPEYASDKVIESLVKLMRTTLRFGNQVAEGTITEGRIASVERRLSAELVQVLSMADQATLEGRGGARRAGAAIEAAVTTIRIAYRFEIIARGRLSRSDTNLPQWLLDGCTDLESGYCALFESGVGKAALTEPFEHPDLPSSAVLGQRQELERSIEDLTAAVTLQGGSWPPDARTILVEQLESYRRLMVLLAGLEAPLAELVAS